MKFHHCEHIFPPQKFHVCVTSLMIGEMRCRSLRDSNGADNCCTCTHVTDADSPPRNTLEIEGQRLAVLLARTTSPRESRSVSEHTWLEGVPVPVPVAFGGGLCQTC